MKRHTPALVTLATLAVTSACGTTPGDEPPQHDVGFRLARTVFIK